MLKPWICTKWYYQVVLNRLWNRKSVLIHRIVALAFIWQSSEQINHIDWNKLNNSIENLEYCSWLYNIRHAHKIWLFKSRIENSKVKVIAKKWKIEYVFNSLIEAEKNWWFSAMCISSCLHWRQKTHKWFIW